jgi:hypothetical protein
MRRVWLAVRVFFTVLFRAEAAVRVEDALHPAKEKAVRAEQVSKPETRLESREVSPAKAPVRSEAITLLAALQREARFVDFIKEPLAGFSDAQIGAVARDIHRDCGAVVERMFHLVSVVDQPEGAEVEIPAGFDSGRFQLAGNIVGEPPFRGRLAHHGWEAAKCEVPAWSGKDTSARVVAPAEVELR